MRADGQSSPSSIADPDIRLRWDQFNKFPVFHVYFFVGGGQSLKPSWMGGAMVGVSLGSAAILRPLVFLMAECYTCKCTNHTWVGYGRRWTRHLVPNFCPGRDLNPEPLDWLSSTLITRPPRTTNCYALLTNPKSIPKASGLEKNYREWVRWNESTFMGGDLHNWSITWRTKVSYHNSAVVRLISMLTSRKVSMLTSRTFLFIYIHSFIHSFILAYSASSRHYYSEALPAQSRPKNKDLREDVKCGRAGHQQGTQINEKIIPCWWAHNRKGPSLHNS